MGARRRPLAALPAAASETCRKQRRIRGLFLFLEPAAAARATLRTIITIAVIVTLPSSHARTPHPTHTTTRDTPSQEQRDRRLKEEIERYRAANPKITEQFADLKRGLADVSAEFVLVSLALVG